MGRTVPGTDLQNGGGRRGRCPHQLRCREASLRAAGKQQCCPLLQNLKLRASEARRKSDALNCCGAKPSSKASRKQRAPWLLSAMLSGGAMTGRSAAQWRVAVRRGSSGACGVAARSLSGACGVAARSLSGACGVAARSLSGAERSGTENGLCGAAGFPWGGQRHAEACKVPRRRRRRCPQPATELRYQGGGLAGGGNASGTAAE